MSVLPLDDHAEGASDLDGHSEGARNGHPSRERFLAPLGMTSGHCPTRHSHLRDRSHVIDRLLIYSLARAAKGRKIRFAVVLIVTWMLLLHGPQPALLQARTRSQ